MGGVVVDDNNHSAGLRRFFRLHTTSGFFQKLAQSRNFLHAKVVGIRPLEKYAFDTDAEREFIVSMRFDLTQMLDQFYSLAPTQVMGEFAVEKILVQRVEMFAHGALSFTRKVFSGLGNTQLEQLPLGQICGK